MGWNSGLNECLFPTQYSQQSVLDLFFECIFKPSHDIGKVLVLSLSDYSNECEDGRMPLFHTILGKNDMPLRCFS